MQPAELNYEIYNKELLTIFEAFQQWCNYLEGSVHVILVLSDHKNLKYSRHHQAAHASSSALVGIPVRVQLPDSLPGGMAGQPNQMC